MGLAAFVLAAIDAIGSWLGWSLTSVSWSPLLFVILGFLFVTLEGLERTGDRS